MSARSDHSPLNTYRGGPDDRGHFGLFGGRFVAETLMPLILDLEAAYTAAKDDPEFQVELTELMLHYGGRPSPLYYAERLTRNAIRGWPKGGFTFTDPIDGDGFTDDAIPIKVTITEGG